MFGVLLFRDLLYLLPKKVNVSLHLLSVTPTFDPRQRKSLKSNVRNYSKYVYDNNAIFLILSIDKVSYGRAYFWTF